MCGAMFPPRVAAAGGATHVAESHTCGGGVDTGRLRRRRLRLGQAGQGPLPVPRDAGDTR